MKTPCTQHSITFLLVGVTGFGKAKTQTVTHGCTRQMLASVSCCK